MIELNSKRVGPPKQAYLPEQMTHAESVSLLADKEEILAELAKYFTSGNSVPVERATISAKDFWRITGLAPNLK